VDVLLLFVAAGGHQVAVETFEVVVVEVGWVRIAMYRHGAGRYA
jgi:hypothetical protein